MEKDMEKKRNKARDAILEDGNQYGSIECPNCKGRLIYSRMGDLINARCEGVVPLNPSKGCVQWNEQKKSSRR